MTKSDLDLINEKLDEIFVIKRHQAKLMKQLKEKLSNERIR